MDFVRFWWSRAYNRGEAIRSLEGGLRIGGLSGFGEFHSCANFVTPDERAFLQKIPSVSGAIIDIGANLGIFSLILAQRCPERDIYAFEPNPTTFEALRANLMRNRAFNVRAYSQAVAAHEGSVAFEADPKNRATTSIARDGAATTSVTKQVECVTIDGLMKAYGIGEISLLKVDVEGFEDLVFRGAPQFLADRRAKFIYYEICPSLARRAGFKPEAASERLLDYGYSLHTLDQSGHLRSADVKDIASVQLANWVATRE